jgi:hypothetical protein
MKQYATPKQSEYIDAVNSLGSARKAARKLGVSHTTVDSALSRVRRKAAVAGYAPEFSMVHPVPEPFVVRGVSTYYNKEGKPSGQWVKSRLDDDRYQQMILSAIEGLKDEIPRETANILINPALTDVNLCNCYVITDYHLGMLSWGEETGNDWDIKIAEEMLVRWFQQAIAQSPNSKYAVFAQLSDFLHFDGIDAVTPASKHLLDVDTRFSKLVRVAIRVLRRIVGMLLHKHEFLHIKMCDANHDPVSQIWLRELFCVLYEDEPRVTVDNSPNPYNAYEFGDVSLFFHHGHKRTVSNVADVFVSMFREMYGRTKYAYAHMGHLHHLDIKENNLMIVEQHRTISPNDAFGARGGYLSGRDAKVITYHKGYGEVSRLTINSRMVE